MSTPEIQLHEREERLRRFRPLAGGFAISALGCIPLLLGHGYMTFRQTRESFVGPGFAQPLESLLALIPILLLQLQLKQHAEERDITRILCEQRIQPLLRFLKLPGRRIESGQQDLGFHQRRLQGESFIQTFPSQRRFACQQMRTGQEDIPLHEFRLIFEYGTKVENRILPISALERDFASEHEGVARP